MRSDQELELFINGAQGNQRLVLCLVSRVLREGDNTSNASPLAIFSSQQREVDDLSYLKKKLEEEEEEEVKQIVEFIKTNPENIPIINNTGIFSGFMNQNEIFKKLKSAAAAPPPPPAAEAGSPAEAGAADWYTPDQQAGDGTRFTGPPSPPRPAQPPAAAVFGDGRGRAGGGAEAGASGVTASLGFPAAAPAAFEPAPAAPPSPAAAQSPAADESWWQQGANMVDEGVGAATGVIGATGPAAYKAVEETFMGRPEKALPTLVDSIGRGAKEGAKKGPGLGTLGAGWEAAAAATPPPPPVAAAGGEDAAEAARLTRPDAGGAGPTPPDAAAAAADAPPPANPNLEDDEEETRKKQLVSLQKENPGIRLEVFCDEDGKKKKQNDELVTLLKNEPNYEENKDSAIIGFLSLSDKPGANNTPLPHVTKTDFHKILHKDSFANTASQYAVACKMELEKGEEIQMGASNISNLCFIDVNDSLNHTRIFLSKDNFNKLEEYKKNLVEEFKKLLQNDISKIGGSTKKEIEDKIFEFDSIKKVKGAMGVVPVSPVPAAPPNALSSDSLASKVGLTSADDIDKYARKLADQFWQRKFVKGDLSVEVKKTVSPGEYEDKELLGHIKIERTDQDGIKVYKVGSDDEIGLDHVNLGMGNQMMQIEVKKITKDGVTGVQCFGSDNNNNFNKRIEKKDHNETVKKAKVDVFVEDLANKKMSRFKIREGKNESEPIGRNANKIVTPLSAEAPKIFTLGTDDVSEKIGTANGYTLGYVGRKGKDVDIKIRKTKNGNYEIQYGNEASYACHSYLSTTKRAFFINPVITKIDEENVKLIKKGAFLRKSWIFSKDSRYFKTGDTESIKILVEDKDAKKIVELEITQEGSMKGSLKDFFCAKRNNNVVKVVSERSTVPPTTFQPQVVLSLAPVVDPSLGRPGP